MKHIIIAILVIGALLWIAPKETIRLGAAFFGLGKATVHEVTVGETGKGLREGARRAVEQGANHVERAAVEARR